MQEQYRGLQEILKKSLKLLKALAMGNDVVQMRMFERLDELLKIKVVESDMAVALKEVTIAHKSSSIFFHFKINVEYNFDFSEPL